MALVHIDRPSSVIVMTLRTSSFELGELDRLATRLADPAVQRVLDHEGAQRLMSPSAEDVEDEWLRARMIPTGAAPTKAARAERGALARPAVHPHAPSTAAPRPAAPT